MAQLVKKQLANAGDVGDTCSNPGSGRSPGGGHGNPLQYSCLENPMEGGAWQATAHGVTKSQTRLSTDRHVHTNTCTCVCVYIYMCVCVNMYTKYKELTKCKELYIPKYKELLKGKAPTITWQKKR